MQEMVDGDGRQKNAPLYHVLPVDGDIEQYQRAGDERQQRYAKDGAKDRAGPAIERCTTDNRG